MNISYLSEELVEYIDAPMPYIVGVPRAIWREIKQMQNREEILREVAVFDLDKGEFASSAAIPEWPPKDAEPVYRRIQEILAAEAELHFAPGKVAESGELLKRESVSTLKLKEAFFLMYVRILGKYLNYFEGGRFDCEEYLKSVELHRRAFVKELVKTQCFKHFIEKSLSCLQQRNDLDYFIEGVKVVAKKGEKALENETAKIADRMLYNYDNVLLLFMLIAIGCFGGGLL